MLWLAINVLIVKKKISFVIKERARSIEKGELKWIDLSSNIMRHT